MKRTFQFASIVSIWDSPLRRLHSGSEAWQKTSEHLTSGHVSGDFFICEECSDADEAAAIASHYFKIISLIEHQVAEQGGW